MSCPLNIGAGERLFEAGVVDEVTVMVMEGVLCSSNGDSRACAHHCLQRVEDNYAVFSACHHDLGKLYGIAVVCRCLIQKQNTSKPLFNQISVPSAPRLL